MRAMRANHLRVCVSVLGIGLAASACGPIAFQDSINFAAAKKPEPVAVEVKPKRASISGDQIVIEGKIQFDYNSATIKPESHGILDDVVTVLTENPDIELLDVVGHTSSEGSDSGNLKLSKERAASVMQYLVDKGIDAARLKSQGKGEKELLVEDDTEEGKEKNRRVEFKIEKRSGGGAATEDKGGARGRPGGTII
jgi:outer membrane protein OmpA-like peptidoglycan-associated protein